MSRRVWRRPAARGLPGWPVGVLAALVAVLVAGCDVGSGAHYVSSNRDGTHFKLPESWTVFDQHDLVRRATSGRTPEEIAAFEDNVWVAGFDASPHPRLRHMSKFDVPHPSGQAIVTPIDGQTADQLSNQSLRNFFVEDLDQLVEDDKAEIVEHESITAKGGFRGVRVVFRLLDSNGIAAATLQEVVLADQASSKVYALRVGCSAACYLAREKEIDDIVESWTVRDS